MGRAGKRIAGTSLNSGSTFIYEIIVFSAIGFLILILCLGIFIDWDKWGARYFPDVFRTKDDE